MLVQNVCYKLSKNTSMKNIVSKLYVGYHHKDIMIISRLKACFSYIGVSLEYFANSVI